MGDGAPADKSLVTVEFILPARFERTWSVQPAMTQPGPHLLPMESRKLPGMWCIWPMAFEAKPFAARLNDQTLLDSHSRTALERFTPIKTQFVQSRRELAREGQSAPTDVLILQQGWACRYKSMPDGRRQILRFLLPGDICLRPADIPAILNYGVSTITAALVQYYSLEALNRLSSQHADVECALTGLERLESAFQYEWMLSLGRRSASERLAYILLELFVRARTVSASDDISCYMPLTQNELAEALGLTAVHVNRVLRQLRLAGLVVLAERQLRIPDIERLMKAAGVRPDYLQLGKQSHIRSKIA